MGGRLVAVPINAGLPLTRRPENGDWLEPASGQDAPPATDEEETGDE